MLNSLELAYLGDSVYELYIRNYLLKEGIRKVNELQKKAVSFVSAKKQAYFLKELIKDSFFTKEELEIITRARNHKSHTSRSTDIVTYKCSTALEAIIGFHYQNKNYSRIDEIMNNIIKIEKRDSLCTYTEKTV